MRGWIRRFLVDESGMEAVEIGVVAGLLVLIGAVIFIQIGNNSETSLFALEKATNAIANQTGSCPPPLEGADRTEQRHPSSDLRRRTPWPRRVMRSRPWSARSRC